LHSSFTYRRTSAVLQNILQCVQTHRGVSQKPAILPVSSVEQMEEFENIEENRYTDVVSKKNIRILSVSPSLSVNLIRLKCNVYLLCLGELFPVHRRLQFKGSGESLPERGYEGFIDILIHMVGP
jgi:hypothetical protein